MLGLQAISAPLYRYIEPLSLGLPKRLPVREVADKLACSVCGARNDAIADTRAAGCESWGDWQISEMVIRLGARLGRPLRLQLKPGS
jgi:hypothetical protein